MEGYQRKLWYEFRDEVIRLDGGICLRCKRGESDGVVLQVHHTKYLHGRLPWEYPYSLCETLCRGCHARDHGKLPPSVGWEYVGGQDLEDLIGTCDLCGTAIRYVFFIQHQNWPAMEVGEVCCDHLTDTQIASNHMESVRRFDDRRRRFIASSRWKPDGRGASIKQKGIELTIVTCVNSYRISANGIVGRLEFRTLTEAKRKAFELIENDTIGAFVRKNRPVESTQPRRKKASFPIYLTRL